MHIGIVGGGIAGLSTAWSLRKAGHDVTLFEQGAVPNPLAASGDHHRIIRRAYEQGSGYTRAMTGAFEAWDEMWHDIGANHLDMRGFACVCRAEGDEADDYRKALEAGGFAFEQVTGDEVARRFPYLRADGVRYVLFSEEGGVLHCKRIASGLAQWLRANGADLRENAPVASIDRRSGTITGENGEDREFDRIVVTAGGWMPRLWPDARDALTVTRTAVVYLDPPDELADAWAGAPALFGIGGMHHGYILPPSGGGGLKFGAMPHREPVADASVDREPRPGEGEVVRDRFSPALHSLDRYSVREVVTCNFTYTDDEKFWCRQDGKALAVSACSGHGYKFGAVVGKWTAEAVLSGDTAVLTARLRGEA